MNDLKLYLISGVIGIGPWVGILLKSWFKKKATEHELHTAQLEQKIDYIKQHAEDEHKRTQDKLDGMKKELDHVDSVHGFDPEDIECKQYINEELERLREKAEADRVTVWSFHNGSYFSTGVPQRKVSTVFEALPPDRETASEYDILRGELLNGFTLILSRLNLGALQNKGGASTDPGITVFSACESCPLFKNCTLLPVQKPFNCIVRCDIDDMPMNSKFYRIMKKLGTKVWYGRTICNEEGKAVGVVTIHFNNASEASKNFLTGNSEALCDTCTRLLSSISYLFDIGLTKDIKLI